MTYATATPSQRRDVNTAAMKLAAGTSAARENFGGNGVSNDADVDSLLAGMAVALATTGTEPVLPDTQAIVMNDAAMPVQSSTGAAVPGSHVAIVEEGAVTVKLAASIAPVRTGLVTGVTVTGTGTKLNLTVSNGVITAAALSA